MRGTKLECAFKKLKVKIVGLAIQKLYCQVPDGAVALFTQNEMSPLDRPNTRKREQSAKVVNEEKSERVRQTVESSEEKQNEAGSHGTRSTKLE